jgi:ribosomal protein S18 acetylase RimI-like enzyme
MVRRATSADARGIAGVHVTAWQEAYARVLPAKMLAALSVEHRERQWRQIIDTPDEGTAVFVAEAEGTIVGIGCCGRQRTGELAARGFSGEIQALYVLQAYHRRGLGRALMRAMAHHLVSLPVAEASAWVLSENTAAHRFYEALGAQMIDSRIDIVWGQEVVEVAYGWRTLNW